MGKLINGQWHRSGLDAILFNGVLRRPPSIFRDWLTADGSAQGSSRRFKTSIAAAALAAIAACAFAQVVWQRPIRHETITFYDASRDNRPVAVEIAVRRDKEIQANAGLIKLPVAVAQSRQHGRIHPIQLPGERVGRARLHSDQHPARSAD
jgi:hypothetical protein